MVLPVRI